ncbi:MAG: methyltransferase domain-containing protein [Acidimicrobiales bacterium]
MLTVDYARLDVRRGMRVLDLGAGFGRHAFATARLGADVVAVDLAMDEMVATKDTFAAMYLEREIPANASTTCVQANGLNLPFADASFDRIIASEVLEHVPDDLAVMAELLRVLAPGGRLAATVPAAVPEQICWWLSDEYHAPKSVGGHVRIYGQPELRTKLASVGFVPAEAHRAHALHSPYWWLKCAVGVDNEDNPAVRAYLRFLTWDIVKAPKLTRRADKLLNPVLGKSLVIYADRPGVPVMVSAGSVSAA